MRRYVTFTAAWLLATGVATTAAWQGVSLVTDEVTDQRADSLGADEVAAALDSTSSTQPGDPTTAPTATTPTTAPDATDAPATTTTAEPSETRTYPLVGGTTALRFTPSGVEVLWSTPNPGFSVKTEPENSNGVKVEFEGNGHKSRVDGWWDGGPQDRTREDD